MKKEIKSQKNLKEMYDMTTKQGRKAVLILTLGIGLAGGYVLGHYADTRITGEVATYNGGKIKQVDLYNTFKNNMQGSNVVKTHLALATFGNTYGKDVKKEDVEKAVSFYEKTGMKQLGSKLDKEELTKQQLAFEKGLKAEMSVSNKELKEAQTYYKAPIEFNFYVFDEEDTAKGYMEELETGKSIASSGYKDKLVAGGDEVITYTNSVEYSYEDLSSMFPQEVLDKLYSMKSSETAMINHEAVNNNGQKKIYYYVLKLDKAEEKSDNWKDNKKALTNLVKTKKAETDAKEVNNAIKKVFKENNVKINDEYLKKALSDYTN